MQTIEELKRSAVSRRAFLNRMGAAGLGVAAVALLDGCGGGGGGGFNPGGGGGGGSTGNFPLSSIPGRNDNEKVLNYALTLEILEADLYRQALNLAAGLALSTRLFSSPNLYTLKVGAGGLGGPDATAGFEYLRQFAFVEAAHRDFLKTAISGMGAPLATANSKGYQFGNAVAPNLKAILQALLPLEETGVRAYLGAAPYLTSFTLAQTAVSIYSTEARHSAAIRYIVDADRNPGPEPMSGDHKVTATYPHENTFEYFLTPGQVNSAIQPFLVK